MIDPEIHDSAFDDRLTVDFITPNELAIIMLRQPALPEHYNPPSLSNLIPWGLCQNGKSSLEEKMQGFFGRYQAGDRQS